MIKFLTYTKGLWWLVPLALLSAAAANAEPMHFSYIFVGTNPGQPFAAGAVLSGEIDGTIDPMNPDRIIVNSFGLVTLARPPLPLFVYASIDSTEFNTVPVAGGTVVMSFSGLNINFRACPEGFANSSVPPFTTPPFDDCGFASDPGGGFLISHDFMFAPNGFATAADGTGDGSGPTAACSGSNGGCRVTDRPTTPANWSLVVLPNNANVDPSAIIGSGSTIASNVEIDEGVVLGENVSVDKNTSIGADTTISSDVVLSKNIEIGSDVMIGTDGIADQNVLIENGVTIGDFTTIDQGVHICSGVTIGTMVTIGKNNLILNGAGVDVPDGIVLNGRAELPGECP